MLLNYRVGKSVESPLACKEIQLVHSKGEQSWVFFGRTDVKAEAPILWPSDAKSWLISKDTDAGKGWRWEEKGMTKIEMAGWHHQLDGGESEWTLGVGDGQGGPVCCNSWGCKELDMTERLNWTELRLVMTFLPRSKCLLISWLQSPFAVILEPRKIKSLTVFTVSPSIYHEVMELDAMIFVFWMMSFKPTFSTLFHFQQEAF